MTRGILQAGELKVVWVGRFRAAAVIASALSVLLYVTSPAAQTSQQPARYPGLPSETPKRFEAVTSSRHADLSRRGPGTRQRPIVAAASNASAVI